MGKLEEKVVRRARISKLQKALLKTVAAAGFLSIALVAPNAVKILRPLMKKMNRADYNAIQRARKLLVEKKLLKHVPDRPKFLEVTEEGKTILNKFERGDYQIYRPKRWDGKWRVLIFDISEKRKNVRHQLRSTLQSIGFMRLQDSVWVYPYPCEELIALLKSDLKIGYALLYLIVEEMEGDKPLRQAFNLPPQTI